MSGRPESFTQAKPLEKLVDKSGKQTVLLKEMVAFFIDRQEYSDDRTFNTDKLISDFENYLARKNVLRVIHEQANKIVDNIRQYLILECGCNAVLVNKVDYRSVLEFFRASLAE